MKNDDTVPIRWRTNDGIIPRSSTIVMLEAKDAEIASLRAELEASRKDAVFQCERAADKDCVIESLRAELAEAESQRDAERRTRMRAEATARQDAEEKARLTADVEQRQFALECKNEEKARLKGALAGARKDLAPIHVCDVISRDCAICKAVLRIDTALTCRPQGERSET